MSDQPPSGRARGKARGRSRRTEDVQQPGQPGVQPQKPAQPAAGPPPQTSAHPGVVAGGRKAHRGSQRSEMESVQRGMAAMQVAGESAGRGAMRRRDEYEYDHTRPQHITDKTGSSGERIELLANYFEVLSKKDWVVHQYHVEFSPNIESVRVRKAMIASHKETLGQCYLFDGMSDLKTVTRLENELTEVFSERKTDGEIIKITFKRVAELPSQHPELGRLFNTQMRRNLQHLKYQLLGRYYFDPNAVVEIPNFNLQIWPGCITSIRTQEDHLMMVVDTCHKVVRQETALNIISQISTRNVPDWRSAVVEELVGSIVMTMYNNRTYRVEDIMWDLNPTMTFETREGSISYMEYYRKQYDITVRDTRQPLLYCTSKEREVKGGQSQAKKIYLIPELCCMTGLTDSMRANYTMMKELAAHTKQDPGVRVNGLMAFINKVNQNPDCDREMRAWGLRFGNELIRLNGRILPSENIIQGQSVSNYDQRRGDFSQVMRGRRMHNPKSLEDWVIIVTKFDQSRANELLQTLKRVCPAMGMQVAQPRVITIDNDRVQRYIQALKDASTPNTQIVLFLVPNNKKERYDALKKHCCIDFPMASQVVISKTLSKPKTVMSICTKIGIQMSCKLGAEAWAVEIPMRAGVMIIGYDTYHDSSRRGCSAGAFVASLNPLFTRWYSRVAFHQRGGWEELSNHLRVHLMQALKRYQEINKALPSIIIFYRDGVGDGQIRYVQDWELAQFKQTIADTMGGQDTRYAFIIVNKRINTRFFAVRGQRGFENPPPGTCVDQVVTRFDRYDFFLVSQSVREGTVGPTMYNIIEDRSGLKPDHVQRLTYKLSHLYYNAQCSISVPAPCQYAHKLAFLSGQSLHREPSEQLSDTLFYL